MSKALIEFENVWFTYDKEVTALKGINLKIQKGEKIALIGQNGSGKTTLAKHMNGLLKPSTGDVIVKGFNTKTTPTHIITNIVGYVFQNPVHQIFMKSVYEEVSYGPKNQGLPEDEVNRRVKNALEMVGLSDYENYHPHDLNYGQMKLLTIAAIIAMDPEVYVLDEPTSGQDHKGRREIMKLINNLNREGKTIIVITHDMRFVAETAERTILMYRGEILSDGPTREVFSRLELLQKTAIKPPQIVQLCSELRKDGLNLGCITINEALTEFKKYIREVKLKEKDY
ncbi:MAG: energy-coupling factor ABC transporter ATP-binding protein [Nitrososphaeria archaeon]|nr:energy-coupling factor ABC transporter ATP-binding protein [Nitrososphaeria archaeon]